MDRDKRWERIKIAIDGLVQGEGEKVEGGPEGLVKAIEANYAKDVTDEFLKPLIIDGDVGRIRGTDFLNPLISFAHCTCLKMVIRCSSSITAQTVCVKLPLFSVFQTSRWK